MAARTLSVGAGYMDSAIRTMWMAKVLVQYVRIAQSFLVGALSDVLKKRGYVEKVFYGLFVVHY